MSRFYSDSLVPLKMGNRLYIDGEWIEPACSVPLVLVSPSDETIHSIVAQASIEDVELAVSAARRAFDSGPWPSLSASERAAYLRQFAEAIRGRASQFADAWSLQTGIPTTIARHGLQNPGLLYDYYADLIERTEIVSGRERKGGGYAIVVREPVGVVAAVTPWNHPSHLMALKAAPALAMGCTIVAKPAPESPLDVFVMAEIAEEIGLPNGVFNIVPAEREGSDHLIRHPGVDKVSFTGSAATGAHIASTCASRMARSSMELGGKSAAIVLDDCSIEKAVAALVPGGGVAMAGQGCAFLTRVLVSQKHHDELAEAYAFAMKHIKVGHALSDESQMGPIAMSRQFDKVMGYIERGKEEGARLVTGGGRPDTLAGISGGEGYFIAPTLFANVSNDMTIAQEEIFGPVISLIPYKDESHAIQIANDSPYGLNGAVFTEDADKAYAIGRRIRAGNFSQNALEHDYEFPFGGFKKSGAGREGGPWGMELYAETKTIYMPDLPTNLD